VNYSNSQRAGVILYLAASLFGGYFCNRNTADTSWHIAYAYFYSMDFYG
jgi:hypothetical protein